jgi:hypothetical protein
MDMSGRILSLASTRKQESRFTKIVTKTILRERHPSSEESCVVKKLRRTTRTKPVSHGMRMDCLLEDVRTEENAGNR